jgi:hypothetical protein
MPLQLFIVLTFGICGWLALGVIEPLMRSFAEEAGFTTRLFVAVPGLLSMLLALFVFHRAHERVNGMQEALSRALLVGLGTWIAVAVVIASSWCPSYNMFGCFSNTLILTGVTGGGPLMIGVLVAGAIIGLVLKRRVSWLTYGKPPPAVDSEDKPGAQG